MADEICVENPADNAGATFYHFADDFLVGEKHGTHLAGMGFFGHIAFVGAAVAGGGNRCLCAQANPKRHRISGGRHRMAGPAFN